MRAELKNNLKSGRFLRGGGVGVSLNPIPKNGRPNLELLSSLIQDPHRIRLNTENWSLEASSQPRETAWHRPVKSRCRAQQPLLCYLTPRPDGFANAFPG